MSPASGLRALRRRSSHAEHRVGVAPAANAALRVVPARLLLLCLLLRSSWLAVEAAVRAAPPECCIAGADGQSWSCRSAWLLAFQTSHLRGSMRPSETAAKHDMQRRAGPERSWSVVSERGSAPAADETALQSRMQQSADWMAARRGASQGRSTLAPSRLAPAPHFAEEQGSRSDHSGRWAPPAGPGCAIGELRVSCHAQRETCSASARVLPPRSRGAVLGAVAGDPAPTWAAR